MRKLLARIKRINWLLVLADTVAMFLYGIWTGTISIILEMYYSGSTFNRWAETRLIYFCLKMALASVCCARLTDYIEKVLGGSSKHWLRKGLADTLSVTTFQQVLYISSALLAGANITKTLFAAKFYFTEGLLLGWVYGLLLTWCEKNIAGVVKNNGNNKK